LPRKEWGCPLHSSVDKFHCFFLIFQWPFKRDKWTINCGIFGCSYSYILDIDNWWYFARSRLF
jgi:hypothetical protein